MVHEQAALQTNLRIISMRSIYNLLWCFRLFLALATSLVLLACNSPTHQGEFQSSAPQFAGLMASPDGVVRDTRTNLEWMACSIGQSWSGSTCLGKPLMLNSDQAMAFANRLNMQGGFAGRSSWRLPQIAELSGLVDCGSGRLSTKNLFGGEVVAGGCSGGTGMTISSALINLNAFPNTPPVGYWSSSPGKNGRLWVYFYNGNTIDDYGPQATLAVRLVRSL
jgi:hypothetical protein